MHFHWSKMEDIINRGGGNLLIRVYNSTPDEELDKVQDVHVHMDGREVVVPAGTQVKLHPGESISIYPYMYHDFEIEEGTGNAEKGSDFAQLPSSYTGKLPGSGIGMVYRKVSGNIRKKKGIRGIHNKGTCKNRTK